MNEYIKKQDLIDWCNETYKKQINIKGKEYVNAFLQAVIICPTADVAPRAEVVDEFVNRLKATPIKDEFTMLDLSTRKEIYKYLNCFLLQIRCSIDDVAREMKGGE